MIIHDCAQGSPEWYKLRSGRPTASEFHLVITPAKGDFSKSWRPYAARLIWERVMNVTTQSLAGIAHIEEGKRLEPIAVRQFEFVRDVETVKVGFVTTDNGQIGASPDRFIKGRPATLEIKCPTGPIHMGYCLFGHADEKYRPQIQGQLYVCEAEVGVFYSYREDAPPHEIITRRDDGYILKMAVALA